MDTQAPPFFKRGPSPLARFIVCAVLSFALLVADSYFKYIDDIRYVFSVVLYPVQRAATAPITLLGRIGEFFSTQSSLRNENSRLRQQALGDAMLVQQNRALHTENMQLRQLLEATERYEGNGTFAEILYAGRDVFTHKVVVDRGAQNGISPGQAVIDNLGLIGQVTRVYPWLSEVTLITDKDQTIPVQILRSGLRAILFGTGKSGNLDLRYMPINADIQNGDLLVTSGLDGTYPSGLPVATVSNIERNAAYAFAKINCTPVAGVNRYRHVLILAMVKEFPANPIEADSKAVIKSRKEKRAQ